MASSNTSDHGSGFIYLPGQLCESPVLSPISPNSTFGQIVSPCLAKVVLPAVPMAVAVLSVFWLSLQAALFPNYCGNGGGNQRLPFTRLAVVKLSFSSLALLLSVIHLVLALAVPSSYLDQSPALPEQYNGACFALAFSLCALLAYGQCLRCGFITSGSLHLAWLFRLLSIVADLALAILANESPHPFWAVPANWVLLLHLFCALAMTGLLCVADSATSTPDGQYQRLLDAQGKEICPDTLASAISTLVYWFVSDLVWRGMRGSLTFEQLWGLAKESQADYLRDRFYQTAKQREQSKPMTMTTFFWRIFLSVWQKPVIASALALFVVLGRYANASFLRLIVASVNNQNPLWLSILALVALFFVDLAGKVLTARRDFYSFGTYQDIRSVLTTAIFDKMLRLSAAGRAKYAAGEVLNLLTTDVLRIRYFFWDLRDFIYCPSMVIVAFFGLFLEIGWNTLFGVVILTSVLPLNYFLSKLSTKFEQEQMTIKDARLKLVNDALSGMRVLKLYAWEKSMERRISGLRAKEMRALRRVFFLDTAITLSFQLAPLLATLASFYGYTILQGNPMRPDVAFVSLLFFAMLRFAIYQIPQLLTMTIKAWVSGRRVLALLNEQEQQPSHIMRDFDPSLQQPVVLLRDCSFSWASTTTAASGDRSDNPTLLHLRNINLEVQPGQLIGIVGRVGSGKSSLLAAILGEMDRQQQQQANNNRDDDVANSASSASEATVRARSIGYVPQQPWIQNRTLRANVLFDSPLDEKHYRKVLTACAMEEDLKLLAAGDQTEIGEKGINLSGGQKSRVALARAVYMDADLYVLDDTLSAVDAHVGAHIFDQVIGPRGLLAKKTRLWALNSLAFLRHCDRIVVMHGGQINSIGTLEELKQHQEGPFAELIREFMEKHVERQRSAKSGGATIEDLLVEQEDTELAEVFSALSGSPLEHSLLEHLRQFEQQQPQAAAANRNINNSIAIARSLTSSTNGTPIATSGGGGGGYVQRQLSIQQSANQQEPPFSPLATHMANDFPPNLLLEEQQQQSAALLLQESADQLIGRLTEEEELATGMISRRVYLDYARAFGLWLTAAFFIFQFVGSSTSEGWSNVWLAKWSSEEGNSTADSAKNLAIYGAFNAFYITCTAICGLIVSVGAYYASNHFHDGLLHSLFRSPMAFFDRTPLGRILNRLSNDIDRIDENIPWAMSIAMSIFSEALNSLISICIVIPPLALVIVPLLGVFMTIVHFYNMASVQLRRLTTKSWSSTCSFVQDAHLGADSIRVFNVQERYRARCCRLCDFTNECQWAEIFTNRWLQIRLDMLSDSAIFICVLVAILMAQNGMVTLGVLAMVIGCGYTFTGYLGEVARVWRESEVQMVCIERVGEYIRNVHEAPWRCVQPWGGRQWPPPAGHIQFVDICLRYRPGMDLVLRQVNFEVKPGQKVGIVGRTGAGKSSLTLALFRIVEPCGGQILIDGVDISQLGLHDLRAALTIIPQDPVLFCGSLRINLDPFDEHPDERLWDALEKSHLKETVSAWETGLGHEIAESGSNLSVGQRQLVCLARALLRRETRILVLDEATAAVDAETDARIQQLIRQHFKHCTLLTIAHRLNTIMDYDRILVMDAGQVAEFDSPSALLARPQSLFFQLAQQAGVATTTSVGRGTAQ